MPAISKKVFVSFFITCALIVVIFVLNFKRDLNYKREKVIKAVDKLHTQFNKENFREIYLESTPKFRESITEQRFIEDLTKWRQEFGEIKRDEQGEININSVSINSKTDTAQLIVLNVKKETGHLTEVFTWDISDKEAKLVQYKIGKFIIRQQ